MRQITTHENCLVSLKKIEGQVRGIHRMIEDKKYCIDIMVQLNSILGAVTRVRNIVFQNHLKGCLLHSLKTEPKKGRENKIEEIINLVTRCK
jgi:DNA-binding FrmR family transcriptional regulator